MVAAYLLHLAVAPLKETSSLANRIDDVGHLERLGEEMAMNEQVVAREEDPKIGVGVIPAHDVEFGGEPGDRRRLLCSQRSTSCPRSKRPLLIRLADVFANPPPTVLEQGVSIHDDNCTRRVLGQFSTSQREIFQLLDLPAPPSEPSNGGAEREEFVRIQQAGALKLNSHQVSYEFRIAPAFRGSLVTPEPPPSRFWPWAIVWAALFAIAHGQSPEYYSNQHQYLLHGLAKAGLGHLSEDWLANTQDPTPTFTAIVDWTYRLVGSFGLHAAVLPDAPRYFEAMRRVVEALPGWPERGQARSVFLLMFLVIHASFLRVASAWLTGVDYPWYLQAGLAAQYLLGPGLQPSVFGIFLIFSLTAFGAAGPCSPPASPPSRA